MQLRSRSSSGDALPVTTRTLESLVRLTEARARAELRQAATAADAEDVCELMRESLAHTVYVGAAPGGFAGPPGGGAGGAKGEARRLLAALAALAAQAAREDRGAASGVFSRPEILAVADTIELAVPDLDSLLDKLNEAGELLMSGRNYKLAPGAGGGGGGGIKRGWSKP
jgi:DNA helicase MCM8